MDKVENLLTKVSFKVDQSMLDKSANSTTIAERSITFEESHCGLIEEWLKGSEMAVDEAMQLNKCGVSYQGLKFNENIGYGIEAVISDKDELRHVFKTTPSLSNHLMAHCDNHK